VTAEINFTHTIEEDKKITKQNSKKNHTNMYTSRTLKEPERFNNERMISNRVLHNNDTMYKWLSKNDTRTHKVHQ